MVPAFRAPQLPDPQQKAAAVAVRDVLRERPANLAELLLSVVAAGEAAGAPIVQRPILREAMAAPQWRIQLPVVEEARAELPALPEPRG